MSTKSLLLTTAIAFGFAFTGSQAVAKDKHHKDHEKMCCFDDKNVEMKDVKDEKECKEKKGTWKKHEEMKDEKHDMKKDEKK